MTNASWNGNKWQCSATARCHKCRLYSRTATATLACLQKEVCANVPQEMDGAQARYDDDLAAFTALCFRQLTAQLVIRSTLNIDSKAANYSLCT
jgi:hypothetical protein